MHQIEVKLIECLMDYMQYNQNRLWDEQVWGQNSSAMKYIAIGNNKPALELTRASSI